MMRILYSNRTSKITANARILGVLESVVDEEFLRTVVNTLSIPRHFFANSQNNQRVEEWITNELQSYGYFTFLQGKYDNIVALPAEHTQGKVLLIGAHYDCVPWSPGADDNASAIAALLGCAKAIAEYDRHMPICFVAFNREEDWMIGSADFVKNYLSESGLEIHLAHILEMVGYCSHHPKSQWKPQTLPISIPDIGDFLGIIGNTSSNPLVKPLLTQANSYLPELPVIGLQIYYGLERFFYHLLRSDHVAFWKKRLPALMWTDTANFRNPHYHQATDTPDTLNYMFLRSVTQLLVLQALLYNTSLSDYK